MTSPNSPNSSPELTERLMRIGTALEIARKRLSSSGFHEHAEQMFDALRDVAALEALSSKNELPSPVMGLLREAGSLLRCTFGEHDELIARIDAALNPKDTG
jgi:hypothetical protein